MANVAWKRKDPEELKKYTFFQQWKDSWKYSKEFRHILVIAIILASIVGILEIIPPFLYGKIVDDLTNLKFDLIYILLVVYAIAVILEVLFGRIIDHIVYKNNLKIGNQINLRFYNLLFDMDFDFFEKNPSGKLMSQINEGSKDVRTFNKVFYRKFLIGLFSLVFVLVSLLYLHIWAAVIGICTSLIYVSWAKLTDYKKIRLEYESSLKWDDEQGKIIDYLSHIQLVKFLDIKTNLIKELKKAHKIVQKYSERARNYMNKIVFIRINIIRLSFVVLLFFLAKSIMDGNITIGVFVTIYALYGRFIRSFVSVREEYENTLNARPAMFKLSKIAQNNPLIKEPENPKSIGKWESINFKDVSFNYHGKTKNALNEISFKIDKGEKVGIVGHSGSGKSTISKLLFKMYLPDKGEIKIGNVNIDDVRSKELYGLMKIVPQENELINASIYENLKFGTSRRVNSQEIIDSLKKAKANEFVSKLPDKIHTIVGPNGVRLSGGEKQRLCIARALLSKPEVLVLDEATSHLDVITEKKIHDELHKMGKDQTVIAITHRISSMYLFDRILVIYKGKIVGEGTHNQLLKSNSYYRDLWRQSKKIK